MTRVSSLYLHVPFCRHLCNYCDFYKRKLDPSLSQFESFHQFLQESTKVHSAFLIERGLRWAPMDTVYLGGGTPSLWGPQGAQFIRKILPPMGDNLEFTMEVDPGTWSDELFEAWKEVGLNRVSIGTQTLNSKFLKIMDRVHSLDESFHLLEKMQKEKWNFSLDFLLGIPFSKEKKRDIQGELETFLSFNPSHISLYILNARSKYPLIQKLPDDDYIREEYLFVSDYLKSRGFHHYEVSNFSLPGFESRHNQKYWLGKSVAALGPTGTGFVNLSPSQAVRYKWKVSAPEMEIEQLGFEELKLETIYLSLRTSEGWRPQALSEKLENLLESWEHQGLGKWLEGKVTLSAAGFVMLDSLMDDLFRSGV